MKKHVIGESGIFDSIKNLFKRVAASNVAKVSSVMLNRSAASDLGKTAITASNIIPIINYQEVESVYHPGQATKMLGMLKYPNDFQLAQGLNQLWTKDSATTAKPITKGTFSFSIPLKHIFGFCDDYNKVIYGFKHTLTLVRKSDNDAIFRVATVAAGQVNLNKISLFIPHVIPSDIERNNLYKAIESKVTLPVTFRSRQCDTITVLQSTTFTWRLKLNPSLFDHCDLKNMYIMLNQEKYPAVDYILSFLNQQFSRAYRDASTFSEKFYGMNKLITQSNITPAYYKDLYPLMVFDVSKQSERLKSSVVDAQIKATFIAVVPAGKLEYRLATLQLGVDINVLELEELELKIKDLENRLKEFELELRSEELIFEIAVGEKI
nr:uncharacterized protein LOC124809560 [Hydra vulgaris]